MVVVGLAFNQLDRKLAIDGGHNASDQFGPGFYVLLPAKQYSEYFGNHSQPEAPESIFSTQPRIRHTFGCGQGADLLTPKLCFAPMLKLRIANVS